MLTKEENDLLTQTGPGTPGGALLRSYWQPAALSEELPPDGAPLRIRLLGEDLVMFRDDQGRPGLLGQHCPHRGADLAMGRLSMVGCAAFITAGCLMLMALVLSSLPNRTKTSSSIKFVSCHTLARKLGGLSLPISGKASPRFCLDTNPF